MHVLLVMLAALGYFAVALIISEQSSRVILFGELGTLRSWLLFPLSNVMGSLRLSVAYTYLCPLFNRSPEPEGDYFAVTFALLPVRVPWIVIIGGAAVFVRFLRVVFKNRQIRRSLDIDADLATTKMLYERKKLLEERHKLQARLPEVEQRINELGALLDEPQSGVFRGAPRSAKSQAT